MKAGNEVPALRVSSYYVLPFYGRAM